MKLKPTASMYSRSPAVVGALLLVFLSALVLAPSAMAQSANGVIATFVDYNAAPNWDLRASSVSCVALDGDMPLWWRSSCWWAAFCGAVGPRGDAACGLCMLVTNVATGASLTVRIVDDCGKTNHGAVLGIDTGGFVEMDTDGRGWRDGQLEVNYQFVTCPEKLITV